MPKNSTIVRTIGLEWLQQAEAEHASIASFARHTLQLMSIGASSELISRSQQASIDEIEHAKMCYGFASKFIGTKEGVDISSTSSYFLLQSKAAGP